MNSKKKAFTLIELIIVLALITTILSIIYTFFITNTKNLSKIEINSDLQTEAQNIKKEFLNYCTQSEGIIEINNTKSDKITYEILDSEGKMKITNIRFKVEENYFDFIYEEDSKVLSLKAFDKSGNEVYIDGLPKILSKNVKEFKIRPVDIRSNQDGKFDETVGIEILLTLSKKKGYSEVETPSSLIVKFRNK